MTTPTPAASFAGALAQLADDDLPAVAAALEAVGHQGVTGRTIEIVGLVTSSDDADRWQTRGNLVLAIEPGDGGSHVVTVHQMTGYFDPHDPLASVPFGPDRPASMAMGELLEALVAASVVHLADRAS